MPAILRDLVRAVVYLRPAREAMRAPRAKAVILALSLRRIGIRRAKQLTLRRRHFRRCDGLSSGIPMPTVRVSNLRGMWLPFFSPEPGNDGIKDGRQKDAEECYADHATDYRSAQRPPHFPASPG